MRADAEMPPTTILTVAGMRFPYIAAGNGDPVLFVHASWADHRAWCNIWQDVAENHRFLTYTQRHFGTGKWPADKTFSRDVLAADLVAILETIGEPVHLIGWSYSGPLLLSAARDVPELVRKVVIFEPALSSILNDSPENTAAIAWFRQGFAAARSAVAAGDAKAAMHMAVEFVLGLQEGGFRKLDPRIQAMLLENTHTMVMEFEAPEPVALTCEHIRAVTSPTLLVVGQDTLPIYKLVAQAILACLPYGAMAKIEGVGHGGPWLAKDAFIGLALNFIDGSGLPTRRMA
jgi:pimeloyl-ACP methyl ester carboxylesterase